jgi:hypothetical protein
MTLITYPNLNQIVRASELPATILRVAVLKSNINTDARFKINGEVLGVDTNATIVIVKGVNRYQYQLTLQISVPGTYFVEVEDFYPKEPDQVRASATYSFDLVFPRQLR